MPDSIPSTQKLIVSKWLKRSKLKMFETNYPCDRCKQIIPLQNLKTSAEENNFILCENCFE